VRSAYGLHLVRVDARTASRSATLAEARADVERAWLTEATQHAKEQDYARLLSRYRVVVEPAAPAEPRAAAR
jgi:hypothetical protein